MPYSRPSQVSILELFAHVLIVGRRNSDIAFDQVHIQVRSNSRQCTVIELREVVNASRIRVDVFDGRVEISCFADRLLVLFQSAAGVEEDDVTIWYSFVDRPIAERKWRFICTHDAGRFV